VVITTIEFIGGVVVGLILGTIATAVGFIYLITKKSGALLMGFAHKLNIFWNSCRLYVQTPDFMCKTYFVCKALLMTLAGIKAKHAKPEEKEQPPNSS